MSTWQPIETAPRDGTRVLGYRRGWKENCSVIFWSADWEEWQTAIGQHHFAATHWQPLPRPPE